MYGIETKTNKGTNIERIIYPNGLESRYRYKYIYLGNKDTAVTRGVYGLEDSYDIADGKIFNHKTYEFEKDAKDEITITEYNEALNNTTVNRYNKKGTACKHCNLRRRKYCQTKVYRYQILMIPVQIHLKNVLRKPIE